MADIKFKPNYGYPDAAPFWLVWNENGYPPRYRHETKDSAQAEAARLASSRPGQEFHVLACMATVRTSLDIVGEEFDPRRSKPIPVAEDVAALPQAFEDVTVAADDPEDDGRPF
jgi:hypothetical protein